MMTLKLINTITEEILHEETVENQEFTEKARAYSQQVELYKLQGIECKFGSFDPDAPISEPITEP